MGKDFHQALGVHPRGYTQASQGVAYGVHNQDSGIPRGCPAPLACRVFTTALGRGINAEP